MSNPTATKSRRKRVRNPKKHQQNPNSEQEIDDIEDKLKFKGEEIEEIRVSLSNPNSEQEIEDIEDTLKFKGEEIEEIRVSLLEWYDRNKRDLPWRKLSMNDGGEGERKAYGVWVSEVMLQQTKVVTVIDYYNRWMNKWPSLHLLSLASLEEVNEMWAGLGYYRRARYLLEGAKKISEDGGKFPQTVSSLREVPGIGNYTAGAIASIAFQEAVPVVDGNVIRVFARIKAISADPKSSFMVKKIWKLAEQLVDPNRPGDFNQALMELGATLCTPTSPSCAKCPVSSLCTAFLLSRCSSSQPVTNYPKKAIKTKQRLEFSAVCVVEICSSYSQYILVKRPNEGLLAGLWEFPSVLVGPEADVVTRRVATDGMLKEMFGFEEQRTCEVMVREDVGEYVHVFSHIRLKMHVELLILKLKGGFKLQQSKQNGERMEWRCVDSEQLSSMGLSSGVRKVYTMIQKFKQSKLVSPTIPKKSRTRR